MFADDLGASVFLFFSKVGFVWKKVDPNPWFRVEFHFLPQVLRNLFSS